VARHCGQEQVPVQLVHGGVRVGDHAGRARDGAQQGDFPDPLAAPDASQELPVLPGVQLTGGDGVVGIPLVALLDQDPAGWQPNRGQGRGEAFDRGSGQLADLNNPRPNPYQSPG
jgi:hypothetical protein